MVAHVLLIIETVSVVNLVLTSMIGLYHAVTASGYSCTSKCCGTAVVELANAPTPPPSVEGIPVSTLRLPIPKQG